MRLQWAVSNKIFSFWTTGFLAFDTFSLHQIGFSNFGAAFCWSSYLSKLLDKRRISGLLRVMFVALWHVKLGVYPLNFSMRVSV